MRGLKIHDVWIRKILSGEKTMEVRSRCYNVLGQRLALGNSGNGIVEGYATVQEIIETPLAMVSDCQDKHLATEWLLQRYSDKEKLYGYCLTNVEKKRKHFPYPKNKSIWFNLK